MENEFKWTDELVKEFSDKYWSIPGIDFPAYVDTQIQFFKNQKSKELTKEKEYEILSFKLSDVVFNKKPTGLFRSDFYGSKHDEWREHELLNHYKGYKIHSVRRKSDNEIFTIGDKVTFSYSGEEGIIKAIEISSVNGDILASGKSERVGVWLSGICMGDFNKVKERIPLFTTSDGVSIYAGDVFWYVSKEAAFLSAWDIQSTNIAKEPKNVYGTFSTETKAGEYVLMNKPCLSVNDIHMYFDTWCLTPKEYVKERIIDLAKQKINK